MLDCPSISFAQFVCVGGKNGMLVSPFLDINVDRSSQGSKRRGDMQVVTSHLAAEVLSFFIF